MPPSPPTAEAAPARSYDPEYFAPLFAIEDAHFWFRTRNAVIATLVRQLMRDAPPGYRVLEAGCGTGNVLRVLEQTCTRGQVVGMDLFAEGLHYARRRVRCPLVQGDLHQPPFNTQFALIGLFDVLEHLPDDMQVLRDLYALLAPGGVLLLTVPAYRSLWSYFDEASHHCRRYEPADLRRKLRRSGFRVEYLTPYMTSLFPLVWLGRRLAGLRGRRAPAGTGPASADDLAAAELRVMPGVNGILRAVLAPESRLIARRRRLPIGTSLLAVARKPAVRDDGRRTIID